VREKGGTKAATWLPSALVNFWVSQVPSTIIAALPFSNWPRLPVLVTTSGLVHPEVFSFAQSAS